MTKLNARPAQNRSAVGVRLPRQDFVRYTIHCIIEMASKNPFAALADNDDEVPNQASNRAQAVAGAAPQPSAARASRDRQRATSERVPAKHPGGDKPSHSSSGTRRVDRQSGEFYAIGSAWRNASCDGLLGGRYAIGSAWRNASCDGLLGGRAQRVGGSNNDVVQASCPRCFQYVSYCFLADVCRSMRAFVWIFLKCTLQALPVHGLCELSCSVALLYTSQRCSFILYDTPLLIFSFLVLPNPCRVSLWRSTAAM